MNNTVRSTTLCTCGHTGSCHDIWAAKGSGSCGGCDCLKFMPDPESATGVEVGVTALCVCGHPGARHDIWWPGGSGECTDSGCPTKDGSGNCTEFRGTGIRVPAGPAGIEDLLGPGLGARKARQYIDLEIARRLGKGE